MRHRLRHAAAVVAMLALTAGCGGGSGPDAAEEGAGELSATPAAQATAAPPPGAESLSIVIAADRTVPAGAKLSLKVGQPLLLEISAEEPGELHVHSTPEQEVAFPAGDSIVTLSFEQPGVVDVEDHDLDALIVQLEVS